MENQTAVSLALTIETKPEPKGRKRVGGREEMRDTIIMDDKLNLGINSFGQNERLRIFLVWGLAA